MPHEIRHPVYDDIYFNPEDGIGESRFVFLEGIGAPDVWHGASHFSICELGFGTGLNFCLTFDTWQKTATPDQHLTYTGIDLHPMDLERLRQAADAWPELQPSYKTLLDAYPGTDAGMAVLYPTENVTLMLLWGEVLEMLSQMRRRQNAWYLDGFAPQKNPDMWREEIYPELARLSAPDARVATFTAAHRVRRGLEANQFTVTKTKGFGRKRERITARYAG